MGNRGANKMVLVKSCQGPPTLTRNIIEAASMTLSHDIQIVFSDKKVRYSSALLVVMSNFLKNILRPFQDDEDITLFIPDHSLSEFKIIQDCLPNPSLSVKREPLVRTLGMALPPPAGDRVTVSNEREETVLVEETVETLETPCPIPEYLTTIPEVPTDIETAELFDPEYLEDIEIENEENLSLTIHTSEPEFCVVTPSRRKSKNPKKCSVIIKRKTVNTNVAETQSKNKSKGNKENVEREKQRKKYKCLVCSQKFNADIDLVIHKKVHMLPQPQRQRVCRFCGKYFRKM